MKMPTTKGDEAALERCAGCGAALVEDQRYCLRCGVRRGKPRLDFTAFWKPLSPTGGQVGPDGQAESRATADNGPRLTTRPSRRLAGTLAVAVLAVGILAGIALGPGPASSPADSSTLAQRALLTLIARANGASRSSTPASSTATPGESEAVPASTPKHETKITPKASRKTSIPPSSEDSSGESSAGSPSSEGSPREGSSGEGSSGEGSGENEKAASGTPFKLPPIKHVWVIALSGESFASALAQSQTSPYLAKQLVPKGALLSNYTLSASGALANGVALLSGQGVNLDTEQNCPTYAEVQPATVSAGGLAEGVGCVYPQAVQTLPDELTAAGLTWKAYVQGMESGETGAIAPESTPSPAPSPSVGAPATATGPVPGAGAPSQPAAAGASCRHPEPGAADPNHAATPGDPYLTFRNPFVYFHSLLDGGACASDDVDLNRLQNDLATPASTPSLSWISPSACDDGSSAPCAPGVPAGAAPADGFLEEVVPRILATTAYRKGGLIAIVPDSAATPSASAAAKPVGALLISPFVRGGARVTESFNDFSLLKSLARLFGVLPLGHANDPTAMSFGATIYGAGGKAAGAASTAKKAAQAAPATQPGG
jgi:hypothetical protein